MEVTVIWTKGEELGPGNEKVGVAKRNSAGRILYAFGESMFCVPFLGPENSGSSTSLEAELKKED